MEGNPHANPKFYVVLSYLRPLFDYVTNQGKPIDSMLALLGLTEVELKNGDRRVSDESVDGLFAEAERLCDDPNVGLHIGQTMRASHLGILGMMVMTCATAREAFDLVLRYQNLIGNGGDVAIEQQGDEIEFSYFPVNGREPYGRHNTEFCFAGWNAQATLLAGAQFKPTRMTLPYPRPDNIDDHRAVFGCEFAFDAPKACAYFPASYLDVPLFAAEPQLKSVLEVQARQRLREWQGEQVDGSPLVAKTKQAIAEAIAFGVPSVDEIAEAMNVSSRTLQRQLESLGSSYKELLDSVRADLASKYMGRQELSILDVAFMLGFSEQSSFQRAFKRWFGATPGAYRRELKQQDS